jgi:hypothetical protein
MLLRQELVKRLVRLLLILALVIVVCLPLLDMLLGNGIESGYTFKIFWTLLNQVGKA